MEIYQRVAKSTLHFIILFITKVNKIEQLTLRLKGRNPYRLSIFMEQKNWHTTLDIERFVPPQEI